jgi:hypothetical protein
MLKKMLFLLFITGFLYAGELKLIQKIEVEDHIVKLVVKEKKIFIQTPKEIVMLSNEGKIEKTIGRIGEGPGEYKNLIDFIVTKDEIIAADFFNKISVYDAGGKPKNDIQVKGFVENVCFANNKLYYLTKKMEKKQDRKIYYRLSLREVISGKELTSFDDSSLVFAARPGKKTIPAPWFPAPFYNRLTIVSDNNKLWAFFTKETVYFELSEKEIKKKNFKFKLESEKVQSMDIDNFFERIEKVNRRKLPSETKQSIEFPKTKELFFGVIAWGEGFGIITKTGLLHISSDGEIIERLDLASKMGEKSIIDDDIAGPVEKKLIYDANLLYLATNDGEIFVFKIINK